MNACVCVCVCVFVFLSSECLLFFEGHLALSVLTLCVLWADKLFSLVLRPVAFRVWCWVLLLCVCVCVCDMRRD